MLNLYYFPQPFVYCVILLRYTRDNKIQRRDAKIEELSTRVALLEQQISKLTAENTFLTKQVNVFSSSFDCRLVFLLALQITSNEFDMNPSNQWTSSMDIIFSIVGWGVSGRSR